MILILLNVEHTNVVFTSSTQQNSRKSRTLLQKYPCFYTALDKNVDLPKDITKSLAVKSKAECTNHKI